MPNHQMAALPSAPPSSSSSLSSLPIKAEQLQWLIFTDISHFRMTNRPFELDKVFDIPHLPLHFYCAKTTDAKICECDIHPAALDTDPRCCKFCDVRICENCSTNNKDACMICKFLFPAQWNGRNLRSSKATDTTKLQQRLRVPSLVKNITRGMAAFRRQTEEGKVCRDDPFRFFVDTGLNHGAVLAVAHAFLVAAVSIDFEVEIMPVYQSVWAPDPSDHFKSYRVTLKWLKTKK